ncbi:acid phosphatase 1 [Brachypodium distachyon]|uniref:Acid phosphatase n=1 Tax=Brachypodium distachyon TaxID=15368 RepID=A0A0Q3JRE0_BRADI|nr:acid phosphatase 1 [Brachypodium distachyon]KQK14612.1 hypothetical protein BRADI_1g17611v3 [Brachypodium distachyon]|eukprot:XP_003559787.1 acid phosphatase 1 [Brachypodium distachyon]
MVLAVAAALDQRRLSLLVFVSTVFLISAPLSAASAPWTFWPPAPARGDEGCLSWRVMVEANNAKNWRTVPAPCIPYVYNYMSPVWGQYARDVASAVDQMLAYAGTDTAADNGLDAWVLDVDDTCLSNLPYYQANHFGAYDPAAFRAWASKGICPGIPAMVKLFWTLKGRGFKVFLLSGRAEETLAAPTASNLAAAGFAGYDRLILRGVGHRGESSVEFKSAMRRRLEEEEGYRIRGNVGDQWSDLQGHSTGDRVFKVPNPMYFVP